jgi:hypothetical protein
MNDGLTQCDCCDYFALSVKGEWEICPVCFWEDDRLGEVIEADIKSGANHGLTLRDARANFLLLGACCREMLPHVLTAEARKRLRYAPRNL